MTRRWTGGVAMAGASALALALVCWHMHARDAWDWRLPAAMPAPVVPVDNPMTVAKVELGRRLFYDARLSVNGTTACASCHVQALAFTDGRPRAVGATGAMHPRNTQSLVNVAYASRLTWANNLLESIEDQVPVPMFAEHPVEMGLAGREASLLRLLRSDEYYAQAFPAAFAGDDDPGSVLNTVRALASFVRSIVSFDSPYDQFLRGRSDALSASAQRGMDLFFSERLECFHCHGGFNFSDSTTHADTTVLAVGYHNTGLYNLGETGAYPADNTGLIEMTGARRDMGRFRAPSLRNVALTAPYMHDGSMATLGEVVDHYARGGRETRSGPAAGDGRRNPFKSDFVSGFALTAEERTDLLGFLEALTDPAVRIDPRWSPPPR